MKMIRVVAAVICDDIQTKHKIYATARGYGEYKGGWEFPGGKQEPRETMPECLRREISEELHLDIEVGSFFMNSVYEYEQGAICLHVYYAYTQSYDICFHSDHDRLAWVLPEELDNYNFSPADIPVKDALKVLPLPKRK